MDVLQYERSTMEAFLDLDEDDFEFQGFLFGH